MQDKRNLVIFLITGRDEKRGGGKQPDTLLWMLQKKFYNKANTSITITSIKSKWFENLEGSMFVWYFKCLGVLPHWQQCWCYFGLWICSSYPRENRDDTENIIASVYEHLSFVVIWVITFVKVWFF